MAAPTRETIITYGTFASNDTYWHLDGAHTLAVDERRFSISYDVVCIAPTATAVDTAVAAAQAQINERHLDFTLEIDGETRWAFTDAVDGASAGVEGAEFIIADMSLLGSHRSKKSRAYRVTIEVTRSANQPGKPGVYEQAIRVTTNPLGKRRLAYRAQFTPGPDDSETGTALQRFEDADFGFEKLVSDIQTVLTGTWERSGSLAKAYEEDGRTLTASASYEELIYDQSKSGRNDANLVGANYDIRVERRSAFSIPGRLQARPLSAVTVLFSTGVATTETNLASVIENTILPYVKDVVATELHATARAAPILLGHGLRSDPVENRVAGQVFFLVIESQVLEISKRISDVARLGDTYVPILSGGRWDRDKHTGPGQWLRRVVIACRVIGENADTTLKAIELQERSRQEGAGFAFTGWAVNSSPSVELFKEAGGGTITTTVQTRVLEFERANIRENAGGLNGPGHGGNAGGGLFSQVNATDDLAGFQERS